MHREAGTGKVWGAAATIMARVKVMVLHHKGRFLHTKILCTGTDLDLR